MLTVTPTNFDGVLQLNTRLFHDHRGTLAKTYHAQEWNRAGIPEDFVESFVTISDRNVLRGLHFQLPPVDHAKVVWCITGKVFDVAVDLRRDSPSYARHIAVELDSQSGDGICIASGYAHGFCVLEAPATLLYMTTSLHDPECDTGIHWNSCGIRWPLQQPVVSEKDVSESLFIGCPDLMPFG